MADGRYPVLLFRHVERGGGGAVPVIGRKAAIELGADLTVGIAAAVLAGMEWLVVPDSTIREAHWPDEAT